jgi:hypothetical protein
MGSLAVCAPHPHCQLSVFHTDHRVRGPHLLGFSLRKFQKQLLACALTKGWSDRGGQITNHWIKEANIANYYVFRATSHYPSLVLTYLYLRCLPKISNTYFISFHHSVFPFNFLAMGWTGKFCIHPSPPRLNVAQHYHSHSHSCLCSVPFKFQEGGYIFGCQVPGGTSAVKTLV